MKPRILVVEDDPAHIAFMREALIHAKVDDFSIATTVEEAVRKFSSENPDLAFVDIKLPSGLEGLDLIRMMRKASKRMHIVAVSALVTEDDQARGRQAGADDYIAKNSTLALIESIVDHHCLRAPLDSAAANSVSFKGHRISLEGAVAVCRREDSEKRVPLSANEANVFHFLMTHPGERYFQKQLFEILWADTEATDDSAPRRCIASIKDKFAGKKAPCPITSQEGGGYAIFEDVEA